MLNVSCLFCMFARASLYKRREKSHNFPHPGRIACCSAPNSRPPVTKALHTIYGNNTSIVSCSWWWAYKCPKHVEQIISAIKNSEVGLFICAYTTMHGHTSHPVLCLHFNHKIADTVLVSLYEFQTSIDCRFSILCSQDLLFIITFVKTIYFKFVSIYICLQSRLVLPHM